MAAAWETKHPHVILKFETAALCTAGLAKLNGPKRQRPRWTVQALDALRLKLFYAEPKTTHHFRLCVVEPYVGKDTCAILEPDKADAAEAAATAADAGPGAGAAANDSAASVPASGGPGTEVHLVVEETLHAHCAHASEQFGTNEVALLSSTSLAKSSMIASLPG